MMKYNPEIHKRHSIRLQGYDYSQQGLYFITICCKDKIHFFGEIVNGKIVLNEIGWIIYHQWLNTPNIRPNIKLYHFVVMPNHFHAVIEILFTTNPLNIPNEFKSPSKTIGSIVRGFKVATMKQIKGLLDERYEWRFSQLRHLPSFDTTIWQRNYHDHIIRNETSYLKICEYIQNNPLQWELDCFYS